MIGFYLGRVFSVILWLAALGALGLGIWALVGGDLIGIAIAINAVTFGALGFAVWVMADTERIWAEYEEGK